MMFRKLRANEIDCRVAQCTAKGVSILLYKDARVDQCILDETVGCMNWQKSYRSVDGKLTCTISIWDEEKKQWISKEDTGTESNTEAQKGEFSDAQKRSAFAWGLGRELYSAPFIWIGNDKCKVSDKGNGKYACYDSFKVKQIDYNEEGDISALVIVNTNTNEVVYTFGKVTKTTSVKIPALKKLLENNHIPESFVLKLYKVNALEDLSEKAYANICTHIDDIYDKYADEVNDGE